jgi:hypothetical protein
MMAMQRGMGMDNADAMMQRQQMVGWLHFSQGGEQVCKGRNIQEQEGDAGRGWHKQVRQGVAAAAAAAVHGRQAINSAGAAELWGSFFPRDLLGGQAGMDDAAANSNAGAGGCGFHDGSNGGRVGGGTPTYETTREGGVGTGVVGPEDGAGHLV